MSAGDTMPLNDIDRNTDARKNLSNSLASPPELAAKQRRGIAHALCMKDVPYAAGVQSMLKTSTEIGDISSALTTGTDFRHGYRLSSRHPPDAAHSRASSHYSRTASMRSKTSNKSSSDKQPTERRPHLHSHPASAENLRNRQLPLNPYSRTANFSSRGSVSERGAGSYRSYSLTQDPRSRHALHNQFSSASLKSQLLSSSSARPYSPFGYTARFQKRGFRSDFPAWNDTKAGPYGCLAPQRPAPTPTPRFYKGSLESLENYPRGIPTRAAAPANAFLAEAIAHPQSPNTGVLGFSRFNVKSSTVPSSAYQRAVVPNPEPEYRTTISQTSALNEFHDSNVPNSKKSDGEQEHYSKLFLDGTAPGGFVERVKKVLEERTWNKESPLKTSSLSTKILPKAEIHDSLVEVFPTPVVKRLTRDMIKAATGPSSDSGGISPSLDAPDYPQAEDFSVGSCSVSANASVDIQNATSIASPPFECSKQASHVDVGCMAEGSDLPGSSSNKQQLDSESHVESAHGDKISKSSGENVTVEQDSDVVNVVEVNKSDIDGTDYSPRVVSLDLSKRPSSLQQSPSEVPRCTKIVRNSLPPTMRLETQRSFTFPMSSQSDHSSSVARPSESSQRTEGTFEPDAGTVASSTQSLFPADCIPISEVDETARNQQPPRILELKNVPAKNSGTVISNLVLEFPPATATDDNSSRHDSTGLSFSRIVKFPSEGVTLTPAATADRLSAIKHHHFTLPDVAEDSQEDASTTNLRMLGSTTPTFRAMGLKRQKRETRFHSPPVVRVELEPSYVSRSLKNTRNLPSLHFSQSDLTAKMNWALGLRHKDSKEELKPLIDHAVLDAHAASSYDVNERYQSFFTDNTYLYEIDENAQETLQESNSSQATLLQEIERLSVPSVSGLTTRLSELLPAIKQSSSRVELTNIEYNVNDLSETPRVGADPQTVQLNQRQPSFSPALCADAVARPRRDSYITLSPGPLNLTEETSKLRLMKDLPPLPQNSGKKVLVDFQEELSHDKPSSENGVLAQLEPNVPVSTSFEALSKEDGICAYQPSRTEVACLSNRSFSVSDELAKEQSPPRLMHTDRCEAPQARGTLAQSINRNKGSVYVSAAQLITENHLTSHNTERMVRSMSPRHSVENFLVPKNEITEYREQSHAGRKGIFGSIQKKIGGKPGTNKSGFPVDPMFLHPGESITEPGDRYPTSGLTAPSHVNVDETRSYFSDESSDNEKTHGVGPLRQRMTRLKNRQSATGHSWWTGKGSTTKFYTKVRPHTHSELTIDASDHSSFASMTTSVGHPDFVIMYDRQPLGMSKLEFCTKRCIEKLRILWSKGHNLVFSANRKKKTHTKGWLELPEVYDGA